VIQIQAAAGLQFAPTQLRVTPGSKVRLVFSNPDIMMHNWVLLAPGSVDEIGALADQLASQADGMAKGYLPTSDKILQATKLLGPNAKEELIFEAPTQPGDYPYICTFPGHWRIMKGILTVGHRQPTKPKPARTTSPAIKAVTIPIGEGALFETATTATAFTKLVPPTKPSGKVTTNQKTNNDPTATLTDGKLAESFGPIFANGIQDGAYKMDLGKPQPITAITSWSYKQHGQRGAQRLTLYASNATEDPGWDVTGKGFTNLGTLSTEGQTLQPYTALSRRNADGKPLGTFRWIIWQVSPVTERQENTAFQELSVEFGKN
ncbi:MAG: plastocyanin/azurin family copper-binding protein, partial [Prosthecobacter sp.]|uniref:plastocyanin/azurin family copper-binding protein n=1 Tax=Prosthecobacter sp. TaxID=1965333 RepID=UPI0038FD9E31